MRKIIIKLCEMGTKGGQKDPNGTETQVKEYACAYLCKLKKNDGDFIKISK